MVRFATASLTTVAVTLYAMTLTVLLGTLGVFINTRIHSLSFQPSPLTCVASKPAAVFSPLTRFITTGDGIDSPICANTDISIPATIATHAVQKFANFYENGVMLHRNEKSLALLYDDAGTETGKLEKPLRVTVYLQNRCATDLSKRLSDRMRVLTWQEIYAPLMETVNACGTRTWYGKETGWVKLGMFEDYCINWWITTEEVEEWQPQWAFEKLG